MAYIYENSDFCDSSCRYEILFLYEIDLFNGGQINQEVEYE